MITVNKIEIPKDSIFNEMQYHPAEQLEEAQFKASRSLIIDELFRQRAVELTLIKESEKMNDEIVEQVLQTDVESPVASANDCETYYQSNKEKFVTFPLLEVRHILLQAAPDDFETRDEMRELAVTLIRTLENDVAAFKSLAKQYSACPSKEVGGSLGQLSKGQTVPEFEEQLQRFETGLVTMPIESRYGLHVVDIVRKVDGNQLPFEMVSDRIENYLNEKVQRKSIAQYIARRIIESEIKGIELGVDERNAMQ
ncbi:peptidylprolyl isomerase [Pleionea sediminis]|uniref:peptidylprolyl isomerase n=1 Tax=Pleionea sediminis TaxID=2569479 RepID=UPI001184892C|nr:peptidylprolyl isomerase [Pleionea sediminis]